MEGNSFVRIEFEQHIRFNFQYGCDVIDNFKRYGSDYVRGLYSTHVLPADTDEIGNLLYKRHKKNIKRRISYAGDRFQIM